jgi:flagellar hook protein FlgE
MSLLTSLSSGTTGLASAGSELAVVGDNIANASTVGFKTGRADFEDALAQEVVGGTGQIGLGSRLQTVQTIISQGALSNTGVATDLALQGAGYFQVTGTTGAGRQGTFLTRDGQFTVDNQGFLVNQSGLRVQGYGADPTGAITSGLGDLQVGNASSAPQPTGTITVKGNLQSDTGIVPAAPPFDPTNPATYSFSTSSTAYDSLGTNHQVQLYFAKTADADPVAGTPATWAWHAETDGGGITGGTAGTPVQIASGNLTFDNQGRLASMTTTTNSFNPKGATQNQSLTYNLGDPTNVAGGTGLAGLTQFADTSATTFVGQDGYAAGQLSSIQIDKTGTIQGLFTNGQTRPIGQVGVARVAAPDQLERTGGNLYAVTAASGEAVMGAAGDGGRAFMSSGTLEQSNVDIADQFVRMIAAQRNFEANSKTITTADQLLSELIAMKR